MVTKAVQELRSELIDRPPPPPPPAPTASGSSASSLANSTGISFDDEFHSCRRTIMIVGIPLDAAETPETLREAVRKFFLTNMGMDAARLDAFGPFKASRPVTKHRNRAESPVEVICQTKGERDYVMSCMAPLTRAEPKWALGRIVAKYPLTWNPLFRRLSREAAKLREIRVDDPTRPGVKTQAMYTQVRFSDDDSGLAIFAKVLIDDAPWLPLNQARQMFPHVFEAQRA